MAMTQDLTDEKEAIAARDGDRSEPVPQVMQTHAKEARLVPNPLPKLLQPNKVPSRFVAGQHVLVALELGERCEDF